MNPIARFFKRLGTLLSRERFSSELEEEMSFHREQKEKELRELRRPSRSLSPRRYARVRKHDTAKRKELRSHGLSL